MIECFCFHCHTTMVIDVLTDICPNCMVNDTLIPIEENDTPFSQPVAE